MSDTFASLFNQELSQIQLTINGNDYNLLSCVLTKYSSYFKDALEKDIAPIATPLSSTKNFSYQLINKKIINIDDPGLNADAVENVFQFMYGIPFDITKTNINDVMTICNKFGVTLLDDKCYDCFLKDIVNRKKFFADFSKEITDLSPIVNFFQK